MAGKRPERKKSKTIRFNQGRVSARISREYSRGIGGFDIRPSKRNVEGRIGLTSRL